MGCRKKAPPVPKARVPLTFPEQEWDKWKFETPRSREYSRPGSVGGVGLEYSDKNYEEIITQLPKFSHDELFLPGEEPPGCGC